MVRREPSAFSTAYFLGGSLANRPGGKPKTVTLPVRVMTNPDRVDPGPWQMRRNGGNHLSISIENLGD